MTTTNTEAMAGLRELVSRAKSGDRTVLPQLRVYLDDHPEIWTEVGDLALHAQAQESWLQLIAGPDLVMEESMRRKMDEMRGELGIEAASNIEKLLIERVVACWLQVHYADAAYPPGERSCFYTGGSSRDDAAAGELSTALPVEPEATGNCPEVTEARIDADGACFHAHPGRAARKGEIQQTALGVRFQSRQSDGDLGSMAWHCGFTALPARTHLGSEFAVPSHFTPHFRRLLPFLILAARYDDSFSTFANIFDAVVPRAAASCQTTRMLGIRCPRSRSPT